jgi:DNA-binding NtrC family response regulator
MLCEGPTVEAADLGLSASPQEHGHGERPVVVGEPGDLPQFDFSRGVITAEALEKELLVQALKHTGGNVSRAARLIGLTRASMRYRMEQYGLNDHAAAEVHQA